MLKKITAAIVLSLLSCSLFAIKRPVPSAPQIGARNYILMDYHSGKIIASKTPHQKIDPASITKLMTAYVVFNEIRSSNINLDDMVSISEKAWRTEGSRMFIEVGKKVKVEDLLQGMIIQSGNDASVALAEHTAGAEDTFAQYMNQYATKIGMKNTHFMNCTGLPHEKHYTTAYDIAILSRHLISEFPEYYPWYSQKAFTFNNIEQKNRNKLLYMDDKFDGLKTGYTEAAGYCLAASAKSEGMRLISVVLGTESPDARADQSRKLLNYGFRFYETVKLFAKGDTVSEMDIWKGDKDKLSLGVDKHLYLTIPRGRYDTLSASAEIPNQLMAPVTKNDKIGKLTIKMADKAIMDVPLIANSTVKDGGFIEVIKDSVLLWFE
ncbi:MAG: D-alanyl-D-alanine carboxypeptidase [Gammaproteobacteria bacterium]|nr:MAG: D-alanyl-D-alanine carboxypeptidase [Gammaproteobacteria bacterium]